MPVAAPTAEQTRRTLRLSVIDGVLFALMVGCSESYLGALAVQLGHGDGALALLVTVPLLVGALSQLGAGWVATRLGSRKRLVVTGAAVQAATHLALYWIAATDQRSLWNLMLAKCAFWSAGMLIAPAWGSWMAGLLESPARERYFARRSALVQGALLLSFWLAGGFLAEAQHDGRALAAFATLMALALVARCASAVVLSQHADPHRYETNQGSESALRRLTRAVRHGSWRVPGYVAALGFGSFLAVPFFTPYMLRVLHLDLGQFSTLTALSILSKTVVFPFCYTLSARVGLRSTLSIGGAGVAAIPYLWSLHPTFEQLLWVHALGGIAWAAVEYASFQLLLVGSDARSRLDFLALSACMTSLLQLLGSVVGGALLDCGGSSYDEIFRLSAVGRALPLVLLISLPKTALPRALPRLVFRLLGVAPVVGPRFRPVLRSPSPEDSLRGPSEGATASREDP